SSRRRHTRSKRDWSSDVCSSDLDVDDPRLADYRDLKDGARRRRDGSFIAESRQVVRRLLGGSRFHARSVLATEAAVEDLRDLLEIGRASCRERVWGGVGWGGVAK